MNLTPDQSARVQEAWNNGWRPPGYLTQPIDRLDRLEAKLDKLIAALAEEDEDQPSLTLDGHPAGGERDKSRSL